MVIYQPGWLGLMVVAAVVLAVLMLLYRVTRGSGAAVAWAILALLLLGGFFLVGSYPKRAVPVAEIAQRLATTREPSTEEMWSRITEARIPLDDEDASEVPPEPQVPPRPEWVDKAPARVGDVYRVVVRSEPFSTVDECYEQLERRFPVEVQRYLATIVPPQQKQLVQSHSLDEMGITLDYIMRQICQQEFTEPYDSSVGDMKRVHVLMEFSPDVEKHLRGNWQSLVRQDGLVVVAKIAALVLVILASVYALLQVDTWTRGYYSKRLLIGASAAIIAIAVALFVS